MLPLLHTLTPTRRRFLGSAAMTMLAARLGMTGSARARTTTSARARTDRSPHDRDAPDADTATADYPPLPASTSRRPTSTTSASASPRRACPSKELVDDRSQGVQLATIQELTRYWATDYDWRALEATLNALPQFTTEIDGRRHPLHPRQVASTRTRLPLIMTHGWPGSVIELLGTIGPLTDPTAHGGTAEDAFDLVLPSLPGYGFSAEPTELGWDPVRTAQAWAELMHRLGYDRYVAQGGDVGAIVTDAMGRQAPEGLARHPHQLAA